MFRAYRDCTHGLPPGCVSASPIVPYLSRDASLIDRCGTKKSLRGRELQETVGARLMGRGPYEGLAAPLHPTDLMSVIENLDIAPHGP